MHTRMICFQYHYIVVILLFINSLGIYSQHNLTIEITQLRNNKGQIYFELFDQNHKSVKGGSGAIINNKCIIEIANLKQGKYAFNYFHDENSNQKLDLKLFFIPTEGYGFSNNVTGKFGPPDFDKWLFDIKNNTIITCTPTYLVF